MEVRIATSTSMALLVVAQPLSMPAVPLSEAQWRPRMQALARRGAWQNALSLLDDVREAGGEVSNGGWSAAITACARAQPPAWAAALRTLDQVPEADVKCYTAAMSACRDVWPRALDLLKQMKAADVQPNSFTLAACLSALAEGAEWRRALALFRSAPDAVASDRRVANAAMLACARAGRVADAEDVLRRTPQPAEPPDAFTNYALVLARLRAGEPERAIRLLATLRERRLSLSAPSFHALLRDAYARGAPADALAVLGEMRAAGLPMTDAALRLAVCTGLRRAPTWRAALAALRSIPARERLAALSDRSCDALLKTCVSAEPPQWEAALELLDAFKAWRVGEAGRLHALALTACSRARQPEPARRVLLS